ncbi:MAG: hypothetical protein NT062_23965, partial [Proteobacteria bacterium]|nr:hypothetical protein [Pseudomonadota bacterium]
RALIAAVPATDKTLRIYPGYFHDLLHEPDGHGKLVEDDLVAWLDAHTGGAAVPAPPIYAGELDGDPRGRAQAIELAAGVAQGGDTHHFSGALAVNVVRSAPIGWHLALTGRFVGDFRSLALRPLGLAMRAGGAVVGLSAGMAVVTGKELAYAAGGWAELPLGPFHLGAAAEWSRLARNAGGDAPLASDLLWTSASLRFGGDRHYWPGARAGVGPVLVGGVGWLGDTRIYSATVGLQLYGAD